MRAAAFLVATLALPGMPPTQVAQPEYDLKARFLLQFPEFVSWPPSADLSDPDKPFIILVLGTSPFGDRLDRLAEGRKAQGHPVVIRYAKDLEAMQGCQMVFICASEMKNIEAILSEAAKSAILTVADKDDLAARGVMINLVLEDQLPRFEINHQAVKAANLAMSAQLIGLARKVY